jgi:hypothetical protein
MVIAHMDDGLAAGEFLVIPYRDVGHVDAQYGHRMGGSIFFHCQRL